MTSMTAPISVGNRATMPVCQKSTVTLPHSTMPMMPRMAPSPPKKRQRLVFANHAEDGAHHLDAVAHGVELADRTLGAVAVLNRHLKQAQIVVQRVDGHLGFDLEAARQHGVGFDEGE